MGIVSEVMETRNVQHPIVREYESSVQTEARLAVILCRNYQEDKRTRRRRRWRKGIGSEGRIRRESVMTEGSGAYKWHEWEAVFPENNARGPRGVGFQENADCFPGSLTLLFPSYQFSIRLSLSSFPSPRAINLRLRQWRRCIARPLRMRACVQVPMASFASSALKRPYLAVPTASCFPRVSAKIGRRNTLIGLII